MFDARDNIIDLFEKGTFPFKGNVFKTEEEKSEENKFEKIKDDYKKFIRYIEDYESKTMTCLKIILVFQYLVLWKNYYMK